jgi:hypothetical protein
MASNTTLGMCMFQRGKIGGGDGGGDNCGRAGDSGGDGGGSCGSGRVGRGCARAGGDRVGGVAGCRPVPQAATRHATTAATAAPVTMTLICAAW